MQVGFSAFFQNPDNTRDDHEVYRNEIRLAELAEPLGFDSVWTVEHHFTDYNLVPDPLQLLSYIAGQTRRVKLGTMVVVLPWHNPMRVAEQISVLDNLSEGRLIVGLGRGLGRIEFDGLGVPMDTSRQRFLESAEMILSGLDKGYCEFDGEIIKQPRCDIRPFPFRPIRDRTYVAAGSPESHRIVGQLGLGILIIPQKPWETVAAELDSYRRTFRELNGREAPRPVSAGWIFCDEDEGRARELAHEYMGAYYPTVVKHYELHGHHLGQIKGYESYSDMQENVTRDGGLREAIDFFVSYQFHGTPAQCFEKIMDTHARIDNETFIGIFSYAGMPYGEAERNLGLFAREVMPRLQREGRRS